MTRWIFLFFLFSVSLVCEASDWQSDWNNAMKFCKMDEFTKAEECFNSTIHKLEQENNYDHPKVYVDRARLFLHLERFDEALHDCNYAVETEKLDYKDLLRAVMTRVLIYAVLGDKEKGAVESAYYHRINGCEVVCEEEKCIFKYSDDEEPACQEAFTSIMIASGVCKQPEDIQFVKKDQDGIVTIK